MLKFRFRKKELRRRSNSCPNLDSCTASIDVDGRTQQVDNNIVAKHRSYYHVDEKSELDSEDEVLSPTRKEQLQAQKSIRKVKKKEKEQQENTEKNLLSTDDFWRKIDTLKEWLHDEGKEAVENMQSPKLRSNFKKFIKLWNKRKLPLKYYKNCCVDAEAESSSAENPPVTPSNNTLSPSDGHNNRRNHNKHQRYHQQQQQNHDQNIFTFDFMPHNTLKDLPSYHHFPFLDEPPLGITSSSSAVFSTPSINLKDAPINEDGVKNSNSNIDSPFTTFGKSLNDDSPHTSTSLLAKQVDLRASQRKDKSKIKSGVISPSSSPRKFATISRSTPASSILKSSNPQIHAVGSPTCPHPAQLEFTLAGSEAQHTGLITERSPKNPSPAYMSVQDAIPFAKCESPKYCQVGFDDDFEDQLESDYCSLSPYFKGKISSHQSRVESSFSSNLSRRPSNLSRRRSKSMEDIYAVPSRLLMDMDCKNVISPRREDIISLKTPPVPVKMFTPSSSVVSLGVVAGGNSPKSLKLEVSMCDNLISSSETVNGFENGLVSTSDFSSINSLSTDLGYQSAKIGEDSSGSFRNVGSVISSDVKFSSSSFKSYQNTKTGVKRRSEEHEIHFIECDSSKKSKSTPDSHQNLKNSVGNVTKNTPGNDIGKESMLVNEDKVDMGIAGFLKNSPASNSDKDVKKQKDSKKSILTGSLNPTTRTPKSNKDSNENTDNEKDRLSILQIKVLNASPTFPRRRIKRRSSGLSVTPGKGLTFGNKNNSRLAVSSPRRVSFAKNVKSCDNENATPLRKKKSSILFSGDASATKTDVSRQSHDKAEFESFWARHENPNNNRSNFPTKEGGNSSKTWSPSKLFSPTKEKPSVSSKDNFSVQLPRLATQPSTDIDSCSNDNSGATNNPEEKKEGFIKSLSPKKLFSSVQKNSSSSLLTISSDNSTTTEEFVITESGNTMNTITNPRPKSILKLKTTVKNSPVTLFAKSSTNYNGTALPFSSRNQQAESLQSAMNRDSIEKIQVSNNRSNEFDLMNQCRSPPRLGVASLKASINSPKASHSMRQVLFENRVSQKKMPSSEYNQQVNSPFSTKLQELSDESQGHYLLSPNTDLNCLEDSGIRGKDTSLSYLGKQLTNWSSENGDNCSTGKENSPIPKCLFSVTDHMNEDGLNIELNHVTLEQNDKHFHSTAQKFDENLLRQQQQESVFSDLDANHTSYNKTQIDYDSDKKNHDGSNDEKANDDYSGVEESQCVAMLVESDDKQALSKNLLERIKSFRSSPKVEENDGWITERRGSRGNNKVKSFKNSPNTSLLQSPLQESVESKTVRVEEENHEFNTNTKTNYHPHHAAGQSQEQGEFSGNFLDFYDKDSNFYSNADIFSRNIDKTECISSGNVQGGEVVNAFHDDSNFYSNTDSNTLSKKCHKSENEMLLDNASSVATITSAHVVLGSDVVDTGYETESRSIDVIVKGELGGVGGRVEVENESVSSAVSSDSGNFGKSYDTPSSSCSIYDVPKPGIHVARSLQLQVHNPNPDNSSPFRPQQIHDTDSIGQTSNIDSNEKTLPTFTFSTEDTTHCDSATETSDLNSNIELATVENHEEDKEVNKENSEIIAKPKPITKPKPFVRPKPKPSPKPNQTLPQIQQSSSTSTSSSSTFQSKQMISNVKKNDVLHASPIVKRRSSLISRRESLKSPHFHRPTITSSFKSNNNNNTNGNQSPIVSRPVIRKRSSVANRGKSLNHSSSTVNTSTTNSSHNPPLHAIHQKNNKDARESIITPNKKKRTSLEKGSSNSKRRSSGISAGPEKSSFAQRRKFFQQLQQVTSSNNPSSFATKSSSNHVIKSSDSFTVKSRPKPASKPIAR